MRFRVTLAYEYEVADDDALETYGTTDPVAAAEIDRQNLLENPDSVALLVDYAPPSVVTITPIQP